jgi:hypothetical protein
MPDTGVYQSELDEALTFINELGEKAAEFDRLASLVTDVR